MTATASGLPAAAGRPNDAGQPNHAGQPAAAGQPNNAGQEHDADQEHEPGAPRGASVPRLPPPAYYAAGFVAGMLLNAAVPLSVGARPATAVAGAVIAAAGLALALAGVLDVVRHHTTIVPHHRVATLVTTGVYRISRNPMYAGLATIYLGGALLAGSWWPLVFLPVVIGAMQRLVICPEERYLATRFGQVYADYRVRARRWL